MWKVSAELRRYVEGNILPRYAAFDKGHDERHARKVIADSLALAADRDDVDIDMVYAIAAYHDVGLSEGRDLHHVYSGKKLYSDSNLRRWFSESQIKLMQEAVEDHRASNKTEPRSIYGRIVAEADRDIVPETVVRRTIQFGLKTYPEQSDFEFHYRRAEEHICKKYGEGGYLKLYLHSPKNENGLQEIRAMLADQAVFRTLCKRIFEQETCADKS